MRQEAAGSQVASRYRDPRTVIGIIYPTGSIYVTNRTGIANVPGNAVHGVLKNISSISQTLYPDEARSTIGTLSFTVLDLGGAVTDEIRDQLLNFDRGMRLREVRVFTGDTDDFTELERVETYVIDNVVELDGRSYRFQCSDRSREQRTGIFDQRTTRLDASLTDVATTVTVQDTTGFETVVHTASFTDAPSATVGYIRIRKTGEIIRYTGTTATTFTGCTRGVFGTLPQAVEFEAGTDKDKRPEVEEFIYLEMPGPQLIRALMTGEYGANTLPDHWNMGIDPSFVDSDLFDEIGTDLYDPSDVTAGLVLRFTHLEKTDGKKFVEEQIHRPMGTFPIIDANGVIGIRRMVSLISTAQPVEILFPNNIKRHSPVRYNQGRVVNQVIFHWNFDGEEYTRINVFVNSASIATYGKSKPLTIKLRGLHVSQHSLDTLRHIFATITDRYGAPPIEFSVDMSRSMNRLEIGDAVRAVLERVRDHTALAHLDRTFEIQSISRNWTNGQLRGNLFGSTSRVLPETGGGTGATLDDAWYTSEGTNLTSVLTISADTVQANGSLTGNADVRQAVYYYTGDLTIPNGVNVDISANVQLRIRGTLTVNGTINGAGSGEAAIADPNTVSSPLSSTQYGKRQTFGSTRGSAGVHYTGQEFLTFGSRGVLGAAASSRFHLVVQSGALSGLPSDLRGTPGAWGMGVLSGSYIVEALGGAGGGSGAGLVIVCRGLAFGASGDIDLSGADGTAPGSTTTLGGRQLYPGAGGGGAPGQMLVVLDGDDVPFPDLSTSFTADHGATPQTGNPIWRSPPDEPAEPWTGFDDGIGAQDMWKPAHIVQHAPSGIELGDSEDEQIPAPRNLAALAAGDGYTEIRT